MAQIGCRKNMVSIMEMMIVIVSVTKVDAWVSRGIRSRGNKATPGTCM